MSKVTPVKPQEPPKYCKKCGGSGIDSKRTAQHNKNNSSGGNIRCRPCNGNGLDPAEYFNWSK